MKPKIYKGFSHVINSSTKYFAGWMNCYAHKSYSVFLHLEGKENFEHFKVDLVYSFNIFKKDRLYNKERKQITCCEHLWKHWLLWQNSKRNYRDYHFYKRQRSIAIFATSLQITRMSYERKNRT